MAKTPQQRTECRDRLRIWRENNRERYRQLARNWRAANPDKIRATNRAQYKKGKQARLAYNKEYEKRHPTMKLIRRFRKRIRDVLRGSPKACNSMRLLGCSREHFRSHLESAFVPGMTWENYGKVWHMDHKRPCVSFDLTKSEDQKECFHYSNIQPLFALDNLKKGARYVSIG